MHNGGGGESWNGSERTPWRRSRRMTFLAWSVWCVIWSGCQSVPKPCDCGQQTRLLKQYTESYVHALEDVGNLNQQLKACREER